MAKTARRASTDARPFRMASAAIGNTDLPYVLTIGELAAVLRRSKSFIERQLQRGEFPIPTVEGMHTGEKNKARLWRRADVLDFLGEGKRPAYAGLKKR